MRKKEERFIITFSSTVHAMEMEKICKEGNYPGRIIPVPREITAGCGLAWSAPKEAEKELCLMMREHHLVAENQVLMLI